MPDRTRQFDRLSDHLSMKSWDKSRKDQSHQVSNDDERTRTDLERDR